MSDQPEILFERRGALGLITLNRPKALNALTHDMCLKMKAQLDAWAGDSAVAAVAVQGAGDKAFCAGGDIRALYESGKAKTSYARDFWRDEYILNAAIKHYPKPYIAFLKGIVMGGGVGVSLHGSRRIADESVVFAMPETGIGLFPDVGGSYFLPRMKGSAGMYLALTGTRLKAADCLYTEIATDLVPAHNSATVIARLVDGATPAEAVAGLCSEPALAPLLAIASEIDAVFRWGSVEEIAAALQRENWEWSRAAYNALMAKSPTSLKIAYRQLCEGGKLSFDDCMRMEYRIVTRIIGGHDFYEGVRATILDKDGAPKWRPPKLEAVQDSEIDRYFEPLEDELAI